MKIIIIIIKCFKKKVHKSNIKILYYDELDLSEGIDFNNTATLASESELERVLFDITGIFR